MYFIRRWLLFAAVASGLLNCRGSDWEAQAGNLVGLENGWQIQSAAALSTNKSGVDGTTISLSRFAAAGWQPATVPTTVLGALVNDGFYTNIYFGTNLDLIPRAEFLQPWWFRKEFSISRKQAAENAGLIFEGINYRANVWLNGTQIATSNQVFGAYRIFKLDLSGKLKRGKNVLAVEVFPPQPGDFTMGFVDWNPRPPDRGMGLFRPVKLHFYQTVAVENVFVESKIDHTNWSQAALTIHADLLNHSNQKVETQVNGKIGEVAFGENFTLQPGEKRSIALTAEENPQLNLAHAKLWWPWELGQPNLYDLKLTATVNGKISDDMETSFGIREVIEYSTPEGYRGYEINGKKILIRGGGWADELLLRESETNLEAQLQYVKAMNLNTIRMEGIWGESQRIFDLADRYGLLIMAGWSCQWEWPGQLGKDCDRFGGIKSEDDMQLATNYLRDQVLWLRNHPSIYLWVLGSDLLPRPELERRYDALLDTIDPTRPRLMTCGGHTSAVSGPSGVKMNGPYDYVTPVYWYDDTNEGGAFGFNTETGPGPEPPPLESLRRMIPEEDLWPINRVWEFHNARGDFRHLYRYMKAFNRRYGSPRSVEEFAFKSQAVNYEAMRAMFEAFAANQPRTTGIIQWMLNPSWPKLYWQLYDYYLVPGGAFYGAKQGAAPFAVIYNYGDKGIYLANQYHENFGDCRTTITVYDLNSKKLLEQMVTNTPMAYGSEKIFDLSKLTPDTPVYFLDLCTMGNSNPKARANNFYWLSTKPDVIHEGENWYATTNTSFADFTPLTRMTEANVRAGVKFETEKRIGTDMPMANAEVTLTNTSDVLAFFIEMRVVDEKSQQSLTPVFWDDNYISLPPHTTRTYHARFPNDRKPELKLKGWKVKFEMVSGS